MSCAFCRVVVALLSGLAAASIGILAAATVTIAAPNKRHQIVVYYANETTAQASQSANYHVLLSLLRRSSNPDAKPIADALEQDAKEFPDVVRRDVERLLTVAKSRGFDLAVFTNALALDRQFLFYASADGTEETKPFLVLEPAPSPALATAPLARPEYLRAALIEVGDLYPPNSLDVILITISHGAGDLALTPRVFADLTVANATDLSAELSQPVADGGPPPLWAAYPGTTKLAYWRALSEAGGLRGMHFPLVFREACESGVSGLGELLELPGSVGTVAHTGDALIVFADLDDAALFDVAGGDDVRLRHAFATLAADGVHVDGRLSLWFELMDTMLRRWYPYLFFLPLLVWLAWQGGLALSSRFRHRFSSRSPTRAVGLRPKS